MSTEQFSKEEIQEFITEAEDLLNTAESNLIGMDKGEDFATHYASVFRVFHSLKGGGSMLGLTALQNHMHQVESMLTPFKTEGSMPKNYINFFLTSIDAARKIMAGENVQFNYSLTSATPAAPAKAKINTEKSENKLVAYAVDDEKEILSTLSELLLEGNFTVETFEQPENLLKRITEKRPDVVLTDMKMPTMTGLDVLKEIRKLDSELPVIFVSGYLSMEVLIEAIQAGVFAAVEKPFNNDILLKYASRAAVSYKTMNYFNRSVNLILYQFTDLDDFLKTAGKEDVRKSIKTEIEQLLGYRKALKQLSKTESK